MRCWPACALVATGPVGGLGCSEPEYVPPPPPVVLVARPEQRTITEFLDVTGNVEAVETVEIRARVEGFLQKVDFVEGQVVEEGDLLYQIDPAEYEARVEQAEAALATARAARSLADATLKRREQAFRSGAVSELEVLENRAQLDAAVARVQAAEAELRRAKLDLGYTTIHSPTTGRIGRSFVDPGNLVGAAEKTLLTRVVRYDPIYTYMSISERALLRLAKDRQVEENEVEGERRPISVVDRIPIEIARVTDEGFPIKGLLDYADQGVDPETGTLLLRAVFENKPPVKLIPGLFVRGRIPLRQREGALLVSDRALGADQSGRYVIVVDENDVARYRPVKVGVEAEGLRVIEEGLSPEDRVVTEGVLFVRPGAKVQPEDARRAAARQSQPAAGSSPGSG